jgi:hypothetical protein
MPAHGVGERKLVTTTAGVKIDGKAGPILCVVGLLLFAGSSHLVLSEANIIFKFTMLTH